MSQREELLRAARNYITWRGWPVFVLSSSKVPVPNCERCRQEHTTSQRMRDCECLTCHGFYAATLDMTRVQEMVRLHPRGLLAVRTRAVSGTVVIDVDARGIPAMRQMIADGLLPRTLVQRTGSGYHLVYAHPGIRIASGPGKGGLGIDIKAMMPTSWPLRLSTRVPVGRTGGLGRSPASWRRCHNIGCSACASLIAWPCPPGFRLKQCGAPSMR